MPRGGKREGAGRKTSPETLADLRSVSLLMRLRGLSQQDACAYVAAAKCFATGGDTFWSALAGFQDQYRSRAALTTRSEVLSLGTTVRRDIRNVLGRKIGIPSVCQTMVNRLLSGSSDVSDPETSIIQKQEAAAQGDYIDEGDLPESGPESVAEYHEALERLLRPVVREFENIRTKWSQHIRRGNMDFHNSSSQFSRQPKRCRCKECPEVHSHCEECGSTVLLGPPSQVVAIVRGATSPPAEAPAGDTTDCKLRRFPNVDRDEVEHLDLDAEIPIGLQTVELFACRKCALELVPARPSP